MDVRNFQFVFILHYEGSDMENSTIREAYLDKRGNIKHIIKRVSFLSNEDERRVINLLKGKISAIELKNVALINQSHRKDRLRSNTRLLQKTVKENATVKSQTVVEMNEKNNKMRKMLFCYCRIFVFHGQNHKIQINNPFFVTSNANFRTTTS